MSKEEIDYKKRNWLIRTLNILSELEPGVLYTPPNIRDFLREKYHDAVSYRTIQKLLDEIINTQEKGLTFEKNGKRRSLVTRTTADDNLLYEIKEY